jgi:hypothetical protein
MIIPIEVLALAGALVAGVGYLVGTVKGKADLAAAKAELVKLKADVNAELPKIEVAAKADVSKVEADVKAAVAKVKALVAKL